MVLNAATHALKSAGVTAPSPLVSAGQSGSGTGPIAMTVVLPVSVTVVPVSGSVPELSMGSNTERVTSPVSIFTVPELSMGV